MVYRRFNSYFTFAIKEKFHFYCCLVKEGWALKVAQQFTIRGIKSDIQIFFSSCWSRRNLIHCSSIFFIDSAYIWFLLGVVISKQFIYLPLMLCVITELLRDKDIHKSTYMYRSSHWRCSVKNGVLKYFANFRVKYLCWSLFLSKRLQIFKNTYFEKHLWMTASVKICNTSKYVIKASMKCGLKKCWTQLFLLSPS